MRRRRGWVLVALCVLAAAVVVVAPSGRATATAGMRPPVVAGDLPDPELVRAGLRWYLYGTNVFPYGFTVNVPLFTSDDADAWSYAGDALPRLGTWARPGRTWAPGVLWIGGTWHLYYTASEAATGWQCIGHATATGPTGPFEDRSAGPLICQRGRGGSIDADPFYGADGMPYLLWKSDDNALGSPPVIWSSPLGNDGAAALTGPAPMLTADQSWQGGVVEGPAMAVFGGRYWLLYGANDWTSADYGVGVASCAGPLGGCTNLSTSGPWIGTGPGITGPGGPSVAMGPTGEPALAFHGWVRAVGYPDGERAGYVEAIDLAGSVPVLRPDRPRTLHEPFGYLDWARIEGDGVRVGGWAIDPDSPASIRIHAYVDGSGYDLGPAAGARPDVASVFWTWDALRGFDAVLPLGPGPGTHQICAYAINTAGPGTNQTLGCAVVPG